MMRVQSRPLLGSLPRSLSSRACRISTALATIIGVCNAPATSTFSEAYLKIPGGNRPSCFFNTRIVQVTELLLFLSRLYERQLGVAPTTEVSIGLAHGGLAG